MRSFLALMVVGMGGGAALTGCGGAAAGLLGSAASDGGGAPPSDDAGRGPPPDDVGGATAPDAGAVGPRYLVHVHATQTAVTFSDGFSGETPLDQHLGVRSLTLLRSPSDRAPVLVFDNGAAVVDAPANDGDDTVVGSAVAAALPAGAFTIAKVAVGYYDFKVAGTIHASGVATPGDYHDVEVLANGVTYGGQTFNEGYYSFTFEVGGTAYGTVTGTDLVTPADLATDGLTLVAAGDAATYVFPVSVTLDPALAADVSVVMTVNTYENFRWQDESEPGYHTGVFDTTPTSYEPVESYGANSFAVTIE
jgi:hypothetical protein